VILFYFDRNGNTDDSKNAKRRVTLLPSATDVFLNDSKKKKI